MQVVHVLAEQTEGDLKPVPVINPVSYSVSSGAIAGVVKDANGGIIPAVKVIATNDATQVSSNTTTSNNGDYLIANLVAGTYSVRVPAALGFNASTITNVVVTANATTYVNIMLSVGGTSSVVDVVTSDVSPVDTTSTTVATSITTGTAELLPKGLNFSSILKLRPPATVTEKDISTPRLRDYFPETLFWSPEVITDLNGKAEVNFKMADNITTWKM